MTAWAVAVWAMVPALAVAVGRASRGKVATRMVAVQLASALAVVILELMSFAFDQDSYVALALALALTSTVGTLVVATSVERWL